MAGVLGIYGLIIAVIIANEVVGYDNGKPAYTYWQAFAHFGGGTAAG
jgi:V-type H+-transporting ATPase proteolipid subunit